VLPFFPRPLSNDSGRKLTTDQQIRTPPSLRCGSTSTVSAARTDKSSNLVRYWCRLRCLAQVGSSDVQQRWPRHHPPCAVVPFRPRPHDRRDARQPGLTTSSTCQRTCVPKQGRRAVLRCRGVSSRQPVGSCATRWFAHGELAHRARRRFGPARRHPPHQFASVCHRQRCAATTERDPSPDPRRGAERAMADWGECALLSRFNRHELADLGAP